VVCSWNALDYGRFHQRFMEPFVLFVGDNLPEKQRTMGFAMQSFFWDWRLLSKLPLILPRSSQYSSWYYSDS
jgi:hypothetical protein